ncbi:hypothetical protein [Psychroflexus maritimus]|uniref:Uncharacterized protein n=1 Tax=Psychroflexus maritimus TaxID=2714865 RepID=A0A967AH69_9FLAO|nr:hypothetical protein [Psychroflexus maritimus]NGZ90406.1 hypothetical protein [Psychroflexus maritimus]
MIISKEILLKGTVHFIEIDKVRYIPDYVLKYELIDENSNQEFRDVDCIFYNELSLNKNSVQLKPIIIESFSLVSYLDLIEGKYNPKFVYIFKKGSLDLDKVNTTLFSE